MDTTMNKSEQDIIIIIVMIINKDQKYCKSVVWCVIKDATTSVQFQQFFLKTRYFNNGVFYFNNGLFYFNNGVFCFNNGVFYFSNGVFYFNNGVFYFNMQWIRP